MLPPASPRPRSFSPAIEVFTVANAGHQLFLDNVYGACSAVLAAATPPAQRTQPQRWHIDEFKHAALPPHSGRRDEDQVCLSTGLVCLPFTPLASSCAKQKNAFHTARWDGRDLTGKRVALIGTGCSAVQVREISLSLACDLSLFGRLGSLQQHVTEKVSRAFLLELC